MNVFKLRPSHGLAMFWWA